MKRFRYFIIYFIPALLLAFTIFLALKKVEFRFLENDISKENIGILWENFLKHFSNPLTLLLFQILTIIFFSRTLGFLFSWVGQPVVVGEILAGILLGPSLIGSWFPAFHQMIFPEASFDNLHLLSQFGLVLFMFCVGMEMDFKGIIHRAKDALVVSHTAIFISFSLGVGLAFILYPVYCPVEKNFFTFSLFMGSSLSITAFPVLARIVHEKNLNRTPLGNLVITSAAIDDITAWCILAITIALVKASSWVGALMVAVMALIFILGMTGIVRPFLTILGNFYKNREDVSLYVMSAIYGILLISSWIAELIGIHAFFGAFVAGLIMPPSIRFRRIILEKTETIALGLFLPLFFVYTGLRMNLDFLQSAGSLKIFSLIFFLAVLGKFSGSFVSTRLLGYGWYDSLSIGALMNTRGLMELVVVNIGYDLGIIGKEIYAMMVLMALGTTFMTGPALRLINMFFRKKEQLTSVASTFQYRILLYFSNPSVGRKLLRISRLFYGSNSKNIQVSALHVSPNPELNSYQLEEYEKECFRPLRQEAKKSKIPVSIFFKVGTNISQQILEFTKEGSYDLLLMETRHSVFEGSILGKIIGFTASTLQPEKLIGKLFGKNSIFRGSSWIENEDHKILSESKIPVAVFYDNHSDKINKIILVFYSASDLFLLFYAKKILLSGTVELCIADVRGIIESKFDLKSEINTLKEISPEQINWIPQKNWKEENLHSFDLLIASHESFRKFSSEIQTEDFENLSILLLKT